MRLIARRTHDVVAITTDLRGDWNGSWSHFAGAGQVLRQMTRFAMRKHSSGTADLRVTMSDHGAEATLDLADPTGEPLVVVRARDAKSGFVGEATGRLDGGEELATLGPDQRALEDLADAGHGLYAPSAGETLRSGGPRGREPIPVWPWVLVGSAVLVCIDLWLRRAGKSKSAFALPALAAAAPGAKASAGVVADAVVVDEELPAKAA